MVSIGAETNDLFLQDLQKIFTYFCLNKSLEIKLRDVSCAPCMLELINTSAYKLEADRAIIDFSQIIQDFQLNFYDKNFTQCPSKLETNTKPNLNSMFIFFLIKPLKKLTIKKSNHLLYIICF